MNLYLIGLIIPIFSFFLQIWPRLIKRYFGVDTWRWLLLAEYVRKHKFLPKFSPDRFIVKSDFGYPPVIILFLALFSKKFLEKYQFIFSPSFDFLNNYLIYIAALVLFGDIKIAIAAQIIAALTPIIVIESSNLNTRILSYLIFTASFLPLLMYSLTGGIFYLFISAFFLFILFFTHRFAIQSYIIVVIGFSVVEKNAFYLLFFFAVFCLVYIFGGKLYKAILKEHIASLKYWSGRIDYRFAHQFRGIRSTKKQADFIQQVYSLSTKSPLTYILGNNPWLLVLFLLLISFHFKLVELPSTLDPNILSKLEIWVLSLLVWAILVLSIKPLRIFGEGQRYLEYCVLPGALIIGSYVPPLLSQFGILAYTLFVLVVFIMVVFIMYLQYKAIVLDRARSVNKEVWQIIGYINKNNGKNIRLAMFPLQLGDAILYFTKCSILTSDLYSGLEKLSDLFPVLKKPLIEIIKEYKITHIFFDRNFVELRELKLKNFKILIDINNYVLLRI